MLLSRAEMTFDFGVARLDPARDADLLAWTMNQFLYGEVTGIQCGHWLYEAPDLDAARFFSRQAVEEFQHVDNFLRILALLRKEPQPAHPIVRFLTSGMMPEGFVEHVCLEMAQGEGFVLLVLYALIDTLDHQGIREILERAVKQEERHVEFGERRTAAALRSRPGLRSRLLGLSLVSMGAVRRLGRFIRRRMPQDHPVLRQLPAFLDFTQRCAETRLLRMGVLERPLEEISGAARASAVVRAYLGGGIAGLVRGARRLVPFAGPRRLTHTYLRDPDLRARIALTSPPPQDTGQAEAGGRD